MDPVALDGRTLIVLNGQISNRGTRVIAAGVGVYDGANFLLNKEDGSQFLFPEEYLDLVELPLTGEWGRKYPDHEWYLVATKAKGDS